MVCELKNQRCLYGIVGDTMGSWLDTVSKQ